MRMMAQGMVGKRLPYKRLTGRRGDPRPRVAT